MSLQNGIDVHSYVSIGLFSETYAATGANLNSLFASLGMLESAPAPVLVEQIARRWHTFWKVIRRAVR